MSQPSFLLCLVRMQWHWAPGSLSYCRGHDWTCGLLRCPAGSDRHTQTQTHSPLLTVCLHAKPIPACAYYQVQNTREQHCLCLIQLSKQCLQSVKTFFLLLLVVVCRFFFCYRDRCSFYLCPVSVTLNKNYLAPFGIMRSLSSHI